MPFELMLEDDSVLHVSECLRVLPGRRIVARAQWRDAGTVLAKIYIGRQWRRDADREHAGLRAMRKAGVRTPSIITRANLRGGGQVLLLGFLDGATTLLDVLSPLSIHLPVEAHRLARLDEAFSLVGTLHCGGLVHHDLHLGNFLAHDSGLYLVDGDAVREFEQPDPARDCLENLALLIAQFPLSWEDAIEPLLATYHSTSKHAIESRVHDLKMAIERVRTQRTEKYLKKIGRDSSAFIVTHETTRFTVTSRRHSAALAQFLSTPDAAVSKGCLLKDGRTCTVVRTKATNDSHIVIKRYNIKDLGHAVSRAWRPSRAWHSWREAHRLRMLGIPTPEPLAVIESRIGPIRHRAWLVTEYCPGLSLATLLRAESPPPDEVAHSLCLLFKTLNRARVTHGDLKSSNLLWWKGEIVLIDLDAMVHHRSDLSHRAAWARDRIRFLRNWPAGCPLHAWLDAHLPPV
ncbi:MAG TPA: lipopolysaccharide kinase InaA family protein [Azoarcus taiwanensis]|nr:lipopolysaccharide kinase InaA family protein [Azoarcus taiwanensis]